MEVLFAGVLAVGLIFLLFGRGLGRLPGDLTIRRPGVRVYAPLGTSCLVSVALSLLLTGALGVCFGALSR